MSSWILNKRQSEKLEELHKAANEVNPICMQAPSIWDADDQDDMRMAKRSCNGWKADRDSNGMPPCPIRELCLETALALEEDYGVWGGKSAYERRLILKQRKLSN